MTLVSLEPRTNPPISASPSNIIQTESTQNPDEIYQSSDTTSNRDEQHQLAPTTARHTRKYGSSAGQVLEPLDGSYRVRNRDYKTFFRIGRVFSTLWSEGMGGAGSNINNRETFVTKIANGERVHSTLRRFVVFRQHDRFCTCLPVSSYNPTKKSSLSLRDHGIIYSQAHPKAIEGVIADPVRLQFVNGAPGLRDNTHTLVNYARIYTVEMNVKVRDIGELDADSKVIFRTNFQKIFAFIDDEPNGPAPDASTVPLVYETANKSQGEAPAPYLPATDSTPHHHLATSGQAEAFQYPTVWEDLKEDFSASLSLNPANTYVSAQGAGYTDYLNAAINNPYTATFSGTLKLYPQLDSRFSMIGKPLRFFKVGRIFKTFWTEPAGGTSSNIDPAFYTRVNYGGLVYSKIRRFVVIRERVHSCLCLPLYTYGGQGTSKSDVRAQDHAVVYGQGNQAPLPSDEEKLDKDPFAIIVEEAGEKINPMTRLNFAQVYTIQHNVRVAKVGRIPNNQIGRLNQYFVESITKS